MSNVTNVLNSTWDIQSILNNNLVTSTNTWAVAFNDSLGGVISMGFIVALGIIIFAAMVNGRIVESQTEAMLYAGYICSFLTVVFLVLGLVDWPFSVIIWVITAINMFLNNTRVNF